MATATARVTQPGKQKGRPVAGRPLNLFVSNDPDTNTLQALRVQQLHSYGIFGSRAHLIASLAWNEVQHG